MQYRIDKKSGNNLSVLGFGCMRFPRTGKAIDMEKTERLIMDAYEGGVNYYDTAYIYYGSEEALGTILEKNNIRDKVFIADKLPVFLIKNKSDFDKYLNIQLKRLKTDYIDYYLMHMLMDLGQWEKLCSLGIIEWLDNVKKRGVIKQIGFSFHGSADQFIQLIDAFDWDFCQIQYNYSDENYQAGISGLKKAAQKDISVIIMEPLLGGRLASGLPKQGEDLFKSANPSLTLAAWAFRWLWNQPEITVVLSGMNEGKQLSDNLDSAENACAGMLSEDELLVINQVKSIFNSSNKIKCTGCNYCMPCPQNVNIPGCFAAYNTSFSTTRNNGIQQYIQNTGAFSKRSGPGLCVKCGKCEKHCPQGIKIIDALADVKKRMEPLWYRIGVRICRWFMKLD